MPYHGRRARQGLVVYIVAEGGKGVRKRVRAWEQFHGRKMTGVKFLPRPVQVRSQEWEVLTEACRRLAPTLVVVDTQARVTVGIEENSATEMGLFVDRVEKLRAVSGACVLLVHHTGVDVSRGRGSTSVKGAMQTELSVSRKGKSARETRVTLSTGKQKDDEELDDLEFRVEVVKLDGEADEDGRPITSVVLIPTGPTGPEPGSVKDVIAKLDAAGIPAGWGRDKVRTETAKRGIVLAAKNAIISEALQTRRNRTNDLSPDSPDSPGVGDRMNRTTDLSPPSGQEDMFSQVNPVPDSSGQEGQPGSSPDLSPCPHPLRGGQAGQPPSGTAPEWVSCASCGGRLDPTFAGTGSVLCIVCLAKNNNPEGDQNGR